MSHLRLVSGPKLLQTLTVDVGGKQLLFLQDAERAMEEKAEAEKALLETRETLEEKEKVWKKSY